MDIILNCDGGCRNNGKENAVGSWAYVLEFGEHRKEDYQAYGEGKGSTNNRMELLALIRGLQSIKSTNTHDIIIRQDSKYVLNGAESWMANWKKRGWKTASKQPVKNVDLWKELDVELTRFAFASIKFQHVYGHNGDEGNERVDYLCNLAMDEM